MKQRLSNCLDINNILYTPQYVFRQGFSTKLVVIEITEKIRNESGKEELTIIIVIA